MDATRLGEAAVGGGVPQVGAFKLAERLETRPAGEIWRAQDAQGNAVRLTLVTPSVFPSPLSLERAQRELRQLQRVSADSVARIVDQGRASDGRLFVATEILDAPTLRAVVAREGRMEFGRACRVVLAIGEALAEAQKVGVVHRDVSPDNVHLVGDDAVRVTNFAIGEHAADNVFGSPEFLSPEQAWGRPADQRSNIYSLGALLYYLTAGQPPFDGDTKTLIEKHQREEPIPLGQRVGGLPPKADTLLSKAMAKNPGRRHLTLRQYLNDVADLAGGAAEAPAAGADDVSRMETIAMSSSTAADPAQKMARGQAASLSTPAAAPERVVELVPKPSAPIPAPPAAVSAPAVMPGTRPAQAVAAAPTPDPAHAPTALPIAPDPAQGPTARPITPPSVPTGSTPGGGMLAPKMGAAGAAVAGTLGEGSAVVKSTDQAKKPPAPAGKPAGDGKGFRETMWFFKGQQASEVVGSDASGEASTVLDGEKPIDDAYKDDGSLDAEGQKLSLKTGNTQMMKKVPIPKRMKPSERMSEEEFMNEMARQGRARAITFTAIGVAVILGLVVYLVM